VFQGAEAGSERAAARAQLFDLVDERVKPAGIEPDDDEPNPPEDKGSSS
jgi:hypothetical protein